MSSENTFARRAFLGASASMLLSGQSSSTTAQASDAKSNHMIVHSRKPEDLEMPIEGFLQAITPNELFYVRSHHYTPQVDLDAYSLKVGGEVGTPLTLSLKELKKLPRVELVGVMECAGNGRAFYTPRMPGLQWAHGGVGNARWAGVRLSDVLKKANIRSSAKNIMFDGADQPIGTMPKFQRSIPLKKALEGETMLAYDMNGVGLTASHGAPLRVVVPGWGGDCWVKWLTGIQVLDREFEGFFMKTGYRHPGKGVPPGTAVDPSLMKPVESIHVKSVIATPKDNLVMAQGASRIAGAAWSGDVPLAKVEISTDSGRTWTQARLTSSNGRWGWQTWDFAWNPSPGSYKLMAKATDANGYSQPAEQEWNPSGYMWNVIQTVRVEVMPMSSSAYRSSCLGCHNDDLMKGQKLTRAQWEKEVEKMMRWGAQVPAEQKGGLVDYLSARFKP